MGTYKINVKKIKPITDDVADFFDGEESGVLVDTVGDDYGVEASVYANKTGLFITVELYNEDRTAGYFIAYPDIMDALEHMNSGEIDKIDLFKIKQEMDLDYIVSFGGSYISFGEYESDLDISLIPAYEYWEEKYGCEIMYP